MIVRFVALSSFMTPLCDKDDPRINVDVGHFFKDVFLYRPFEWDFNKFLEEKLEEEDEEEMRPWD